MITQLLSASWLRRYALVLGGLFGASTAAQAQTLNYSVSAAANVAGTFSDLGTTGTVISTANTDDANSAAQNIGFTFAYNGSSFTQFVLNTNGLVRLGSAAPSAANMFANYEGGAVNGVDPISSTATADVNLLAPFNFDLQSGTSTAEYRVLTTGTSPNRVCTVQWKNVSDKGDAYPTQYANFTFQLKLYETSNRIEFVYGTATASTNTATVRFPTVGIKGSGAASGQDVLANKTASTAAWSTTSFISGVYSSTTHNFRANVGPDAGRTYRFDPATSTSTCAAVTNAAITNLSSTGTAASAQLTFTAAVGATSYAVTLNQTGSTAAPATGTITSSPVTLTGLTPNTSYTVTITTNCSSGGTSSTVTVVFTSAAASTAPAPANDDCAGAISLTTATTCTPTTGTTVGATQSLAAISCGGFTGTADDDVWYKFVATAATQTVTVVGSANFDAVLDVRSGTCPGVNIGCADATGPAGTETATLAGLTVGATYYARVYTYDNGITGTFTICVTGAVPACPAPTALTASNVTTTGATLTFTPATGAASYTLTYTPAGGTAQTQTVTASPATLTGLTAGTTYTVSLVTNCTTGQASPAATTTFTTLTPCVAVTNLAAGSITATGATLTFTPATGASSYTVTYTPAGGTAQTQAATGSPVTLTGLQTGKQYTVTVTTNCSGSQTSPAATTTFTTLAPAPTNVAVGSITASSASLSFTPATGAVNYTVTYATAGGTPLVITASASPVVLSGLAPLTTYTVTIVANYASGGTSTPVTVTFTTLRALALRATLAGGELAVYPNPAHHTFTLSLPALGSARTAQVELVNALGQLVSRQTISLATGGTQAPVDASRLPAGVYAVQVRVGADSAITRLVIE